MPQTPDQPFVVGLVTTSSFSVAWEVHGQPKINKYIVHYKQYDEGEDSWEKVETAGKQQEFRFEGLRPDTAYHVRVASSFQGKKSPPSMISDVIHTAKEFQPLSLSPTPEKPNLSGPPTHDSVPLVWSVTGDTSKVTHYSVTYRACSKDTNFKPTDKWETYVTKDAECNCVIDGLKPKTDYRFYVSSHSSKGMSTPSGISNLISTTGRDLKSTFGFGQIPMVPTKPCKENITSSYDIPESPSQAPPIPYKLVSAGPVTHNSIPLTWQTPGDLSKVMSYSISYKKANSVSPWMNFKTDDAVNMYTICDLFPDTDYWFCIASHSHTGQSLNSEICVIKTEKDPYQTVHQKPPKPQKSEVVATVHQIPPKPQKPEVMGTPGATSITICWQVLGDISKVTHFTISFQTGEKAGWTTLETEDTSWNYVIEELGPDTYYHFRVSANTNDGLSLPSKTSEPIRTAKDPRSEERKPPTPKKPKLVGTPDHSSIRLCWKVPGNMAYITNYILSFQSVSTGGHWKTIETSDTERSYTKEGLDPNTDYQFCVASVTEEGQSPKSAVSDIIRTTQNPSIVESNSPGSLPKLVSSIMYAMQSSGDKEFMHAMQSSSDQEFPAPLKPTLFGEPRHDSVPLTWVVNRSKESITSFTITYKKVTVMGKGRWINFETDKNETTCVVDELDPETDYWFCVAANTKLRRGKPSETSDIIKTKKKQSTAQLMPLTPVTPALNGIGQVSHDSVPLAWHVPGDTTHVTHYTVTYRTPDTRNSGWITFDTERAVTSCIVDSLKPDTFYEFRVASNTMTGQSPPSQISKEISTSQNPSIVESNSPGSLPKLEKQAVSSIMQTVQSSGDKEFPAPLKPTLFGKPRHDSVPLTWVVNRSKESITSFTITYKKVTVMGKGRWINFKTDNNETTCVVDELDPETDYWFCVAANTKLRQGKPSETSDIIKTKKKQRAAQLMPPTPDTPVLNNMGQVSHDSVPLAWHVPGDTTHVTHYTVTYRTPDTRNWITFDTERAVTSCIVDNLKPATSYQFHVASNTLTGQSPPSQISNKISTSKEEKPSRIERAPPKPQKPTLIAGSLTTNTVCLVWKITDVKSTRITHFTVSYKKAGERQLLNIFETDGEDTHCTVEGLEPGTSYQFQVASNNDMGQSTPSEMSDIIRTPENLQTKKIVDLKEITPPKPTLLGMPSHTSIQLRWKVRKNTHITVSAYTVSYQTTNSKSNWITMKTNSNKCTISGLTPATSYVFRVASNTKLGQSPHSEISKPITTERDPTQPQKPKMIGNPGHNSIQLQWEVPGNTAHVTFYTLGYQSINTKGAWITIETENATTNYTLENLEPLTPYRFRVTSNTDQGQSPQSDVSDVITTTEEPPSSNEKRPPKPNKPRITGDPGCNQVQLCWNVIGDTSYVTHYTVSYRKCEAKRWITEDTGDACGYYSIENLDPDTSYQFRIASNTNDEQSQPSEISDLIQTSSAQNSSPPPTRSSIKKTQPVPPIVSKMPTPEAPRVAEGHKPTQQTIPLVWEADTTNFSVTHFTLSCSPCNSPVSAFRQDIPGSRCEYTVQKLQPGTNYMFQVQAHSQTISSDMSCKGGPFTTAVDTADQIYRVNLQKQSQKAPSDKGMPLYQVPLKTAKKNDVEKIQMLEFGLQPAVPPTVKVILVVGATGSGKSTLINGLFNYVIGVEWSEKCRFRLVEELGSFESQHKSQTRAITVYTLHHNNVFNIPYTLKIIDTPGFGDTDGIEKDKQITEAIRKLFTNKEYGITHIDAIGFVAQASLARLTPTQKYIFDSILSLFGKDIGDNIFLLLTFSDSQLPPVLASTKAAQIPYHSHFKFNNSALFALNDTKDNEFDQMFWKMGIASFNKFLKELAGLEGKSLLLTQEVLHEREQLEVYVAGIQQEVHNGLTKLEQYKVEAAVVKQHEADIEINKDFTYTVDEQKMVQVDLEPGQHVTNCITCNCTCHYLCRYANDEDKIKCCAMDLKGNCKVCVQKCIWSMHRNVPFRIVVETETVTKTSDELKNRYDEAKGEKMTAEKLTQSILEDFHNLEIKVLHMTREIKRCLTRLSEIALRPNPLTTVDYIDILITSERTEAKPGFQARIDQLVVVKKSAEALGEMADDSYDPFTKYRQEFPSLQPGESTRSAQVPRQELGSCKIS